MDIWTVEFIYFAPKTLCPTNMSIVRRSIPSHRSVTQIANDIEQADLRWRNIT